MDRRSLPLFIVGMLSWGIAGGRVAAQSDAYAKLVGTWVMDSTNGPDDKGLPKSETLKFSRVGKALRIAATTDEGTGASSSAFDCLTAAGGGTADVGNGVLTHCLPHPYADSVVYAIDVTKGGQIVATERGRLVVSGGGKTLRDEYDATSGAGAATHHRHIYTKTG
jgi:hypothetical protein